MVEFDLVAALAGGLAATIVMTVMMTMAKSAGMTDMPPMPLVTGSMMSGDRRTALTIGTMIHYVVMGTVVFGTAYGALFTALDDTSWWVGVAIGAIHGVIVGAMFMPMMPSMHPRMFQPDGPSAGPADTTSADGEVRVMAPGLLGRNWGAMTPIGLVMGHAVYGLVLVLIYDAIH